MEEVYPVLTPMAFDPSRPFPLVRNKTLNLAALLKKKEGEGELEFAMVQVPSVLPRLVLLPSKEGSCRVILLEEIIERNIQQLFLNYDVVTSHPFRIMRNADFSLDEEERWIYWRKSKAAEEAPVGEVIRLEIEEKADKRLLKILKKELSRGRGGYF